MQIPSPKFKVQKTGVLLLALGMFLGGQAVRAQSPAEIAVSPVRYEFAAYPGQTLSGTVYVQNPSDRVVPVALEVEDFVPQGEEGKVAVGPSEDEARSLTSWVRLGPAELEMAPRSRFPVEFTIDIPSSAEPGTHFGTILARVSSEPNGALGPLVVTKVGTLVLVDVYGEVRERLSAIEFRTPTLAWKLPLNAVIRFQNDGTVREKPVGAITINNMFGRTVATLPLAEANVLPGAVRRFSTTATSGLWAGPYAARLEASYGLTTKQTIVAERTFWFVDLWNVGLPFLILFGTFLFLLSRRRNIRPALRVLGQGDATDSYS